ncbi:hypothetical protein CEK25_004979 [Fusarium fujikuroi]|nr:hypothetical protein CEK25_004979 [Fusarium fujikuroi]
MLSCLAVAPNIRLKTVLLSRQNKDSKLRSLPGADAENVEKWLRTYGEKSTEAPKEDSEQIPFHKLPDADTVELFEEMGGDKKGEKSTEEMEEAERVVDRELPDRTQGMSSTLSEEIGGDKIHAYHELLPVEDSESIHGPKRWEDTSKSERHPNGWSWSVVEAAKARLTESVTYKSLHSEAPPDPDPSFERPYGSLPELWTKRATASGPVNMAYCKAPGVDYFIRYLSQYYERPFTLCLCLDEPIMRSDWTLDYGWRITKFEDGEIVIVEYLSYLNHAVKMLVIKSFDGKHIPNQPEFAIVVKPWKGARKEFQLAKLTRFHKQKHGMAYGALGNLLKSFNPSNMSMGLPRGRAKPRKAFQGKMLAHKQKHVARERGLAKLHGLSSRSMSMMVSREGEQNGEKALAQGKKLHDGGGPEGQLNSMGFEWQFGGNHEKKA